MTIVSTFAFVHRFAMNAANFVLHRLYPSVPINVHLLLCVLALPVLGLLLPKQNLPWTFSTILRWARLSSCYNCPPRPSSTHSGVLTLVLRVHKLHVD